jgi:hypothetical protein
VLKIKTPIARILILAVILTTVMSTLATANGWRGRGRDKKYGRFINRHDGRDGRFDGRGRWDRRYDNRRWDWDRDHRGWDRNRRDHDRYDRRYDRRYNRRFW